MHVSSSYGGDKPVASEETSSAPVINYRWVTGPGKTPPVDDKQIRDNLCRSSGACAFVSLCAGSIFADTHVSVLIHNAVTTANAPSYVFILVLGVFLKLLHSEGIHQGGTTTGEQRSIESALHIRGNNGCWIIESFLSHQPFVLGLMGFFSKRPCERREGIYFRVFFFVFLKLGFPPEDRLLPPLV